MPVGFGHGSVVAIHSMGALSEVRVFLALGLGLTQDRISSHWGIYAGLASIGDSHSQPSRSLQQNASVLVFTAWMQQEGIDAQPYAFGWCEDPDFEALLA